MRCAGADRRYRACCALRRASQYHCMRNETAVPAAADVEGASYQPVSSLFWPSACSTATIWEWQAEKGPFGHLKRDPHF